MSARPSVKDKGDEQLQAAKTERITRLIALVIAFLSVFFFFFKLLFL